MSSSRKCTSTKSDGQPCKAWAVRNSDPALCNVHKRHAPESTDQTHPAEVAKTGCNVDVVEPGCPYTLEQIAGLLRQNADGSLEDELLIARLAVKRLMRHLEEQLTPHEFAHLAGVIFTGTNSIVRMLKSQQDLENHSAADLARAINQALDESSKEMGILL